MPSNNKYSWLLFDADNTILDFDSAAKASFNDMIRLNSLSEDPEHFKIYKEVNKIVWREFEEQKISTVELRSKRFLLFLERTGQDGDASILSASFLSCLVQNSELLPGAEKVLHFLKARYNLAIITNGLKEVQRPRLDKTGITHFFKVIVVSDEIGVSKPHSEFFDVTFDQIGKPSKDSVLVIGDSLNSDIRGGVNYNLDTCWLDFKKNGSPGDLNPTYIIENLSDLNEIL